MNMHTTLDNAVNTVAIDRRQLARAVEDAVRVVPRKPSFPVLETVLLCGTGDGLTVTGFDTETAITVSLPGGALEGFRAALAARQLRAILKDGPEADIALVEIGNDQGTARVTLGGAPFPVDTQDPAIWPDLPEGMKAGEAVFAGLELRDALSAVAPAMSTEATRYYLNGVYLHTYRERDGDPGELRLVATDGHRLVMQPLGVAPAQFPDGIIPRDTVRALLAMWRGKRCPREVRIRASINGSRTVVRFDWHHDGLDHDVAAWCIDASYPDYPRVIPGAGTGERKLTFRADDMRAALRHVELAAGKKAAIAFEIGANGQVNAHARRRVPGATYDTEAIGFALPFAATFTGVAPFRVGFQCQYVADMLDALGGETVTFEIRDARDPARFTTPESDRLGVLMPVRP